MFQPAVEARRKHREEEELIKSEVDDFPDGVEDDVDSNHGSLDSDRKPGSAGSVGGYVNGFDSRKKTKKRKIKRAGSSLNISGSTKRKRSAGTTANGDTEAEVQRKMEEMLQRHSEAFLTINLRSRLQASALQPIRDPDPLFASELMECRDTFLSRARERHLEFSSLRRAKFSTLAFLYDIHTENKDVFIYCCSSCRKEIEAPRQCKMCPNYFLCEDCFTARGHQHPMKQIIVSEDNAGTAAVQQSDRLKMERCVELLKHTSICRDANCRNQACWDMKRRLGHFQTQHDRSKCFLCRQIHRILSAHSTKCNDLSCQVLFCSQYKSVKKQQESQQRLRKLQTLRRRQKTMQCSNSNKQQQPNTPQSSTAANNSSGAASQAVTSASSPPGFNALPSSSEPPHSFTTQVSLASSHSVSNPHNSPSMHSTTLSYVHTSSYQPTPRTSPSSVTTSRNHQAPYQPSSANYHHTATGKPQYIQQPLYQQSQLQQMYPSLPQVQQSRSNSNEVFLRQSSNPVNNLYENGQSMFNRGPIVTASSRIPYQMSTSEGEDVYALHASGLKRPYFGECEIMPAISSTAPLRQSRPMIPPQSQQMVLQSPPSEQQQQSTMHWADVSVLNGQIALTNPVTVGKVAQTTVQQQSLPVQSSTSPSQFGNSAPHPPNQADVDMVLSMRCSCGNEVEVISHF